MKMTWEAEERRRKCRLRGTWIRSCTGVAQEQQEIDLRSWSVTTTGVQSNMEIVNLINLSTYVRYNRPNLLILFSAKSVCQDV